MGERATTAAGAGPAAPPLLERDAELERLARATAASRESGRVVLVEGSAGVGKTELLRAARRHAAGEGFRTLAASGAELEREFPFGVARQLLEPLVRDEAADELLSGAAARALPLLSGEAEPAAAALPEDVSGEIFHALYWLVAGLASRTPVLLAVDDVHWVDAPSLRWLAYLANRIEGLPVLLLAASRDTPPDESSATPLASSAAETIVLEPLSAAAARHVVRSVVPDASAELCEACRRASGGTPFYLWELVRALPAAAARPGEPARGPLTPSHVHELSPRTISRAVLMRIGQLGEGARAVAQGLAVAGVDASLRDVAALAGISQDAARTAVDQLAAAGVVKPRLPLDFEHPVVRTAVYGELPPGWRADAHLRMARALSESGASSEELVPHLLRSAPAGDAWIVDTLRDAARRALGRGAADTAIAALRRALDEPPDGGQVAELLVELGTAESRAGDQEGAETHLAEAMRLAATQEARGAAALARGRALFMTGRSGQAFEVLSEAIEAIADPVSEISVRLESVLLTVARLDHGLRPLALERMRDVDARIPQASGSARRLLLANAAYEAALAGESAERVAELAIEALDGDVLLEEDGPEGPAFNLAANALALAEHLDEAERAFDAAAAEAQARGSVLGYAVACCYRSQVHFRRGDVVGAEADARNSVEVARLNGWALGVPAALAFLVDALIERGELDEADALLTDAGLGEVIPESVMFDPLVDSRGRLRIAKGDLEAGVRDLLECGRRQDAWGAANPSVIPWRSHGALALARLDRRHEAEPLARAELELARRPGAPRALGMSLRAAAIAGGGDAEVEGLREAAALLETSAGRLEHARALADLGSALRRRGKRSEARDQLSQALDLAVRCGASALAERVRSELLSSGARPRRELLSGVEALTPSERRVADMAAAGMTNREIAQALFVTAKTVEVHLGATYRKLGIGSRAELPAALEGDDARPGSAVAVG